MRGKGGCPLKVTLTSLAPTLTLGPERLAGTTCPIAHICGRYSDLALTYSYLPEPEVRPQRTIRAVRHQEMTVLLEPACTCEEGATATDHATSTAVWTFPAGDVLLRASQYPVCRDIRDISRLRRSALHAFYQGGWRRATRSLQPVFLGGKSGEDLRTSSNTPSSSGSKAVAEGPSQRRAIARIERRVDTVA